MGFINMTKNKTTLQNNHKPQKTDTFDCVKQKLYTKGTIKKIKRQAESGIYLQKITND